MCSNFTSIYLFLFTLLEAAVKSQMSSNSNNHEFLQANNVRYLVDNIPVTMHKDFSSSPAVRVQTVEENTLYSSSKAHLKFDPLLLDFKERHLGVPHHEKVTITNLHSNKTVYMSSISGNTVHFHSSFFEDKVIPPLGNTSFNVVFLGREEGDIESSLTIHTSEGSFTYYVKGASVQSPYRLRPLSGIRLPLNASFTPLILMHNPYSTPLQLIEVYSSGGEFHLELPSGELEGPKQLWEIPAFLTKPIIRVHFHARNQNNHTAYIRLKVNESGEVLVVPVEVEVGPACGLYSPDDVIDFGLGGSAETPRQLKLYLRNSGRKHVRITNVISMPVSKALKIDFQPLKIPPDSRLPTPVATLTFDWKVALESGVSTGRLVVKAGQQKLVVPYRAVVLAGGLGHDPAAARFRSDEAPPHLPRPFPITNTFRLPVAITDVTLDPQAAQHFQISKFMRTILMPGETIAVFELVATNVSSDLKLESLIRVHSNVSTLSVPLICYNGRLQKELAGKESETGLELGTVGSGSRKAVYFALVNSNPVAVQLLSWGTNVTGATLEWVRLSPGNATVFRAGVAGLHHCSNITAKLEEGPISPGHYVVLRVSVLAGGGTSEQGAVSGEVWVRTQYERIAVSVKLRVAHGSLQVLPDPVAFFSCFPGKLCTEAVRMQSLFSMPMAVTGVQCVPPDDRFSFLPLGTPPLVLPAATTLLGHITWDPVLRQHSYLGIDTNATVRWLDTLELPAHAKDWDVSHLAAHYERFLNLSSQPIQLSLRLDTTEVRDVVFGARVRLTWPMLSQSSLLRFPLTLVGNSSVQRLTIHNPGTRHPVLVQVLLESAYLQAAGILDSLPQSLRPVCSQCSVSSPGEFVLRGDEVGATGWAGPGVPTHRDSLVYLVAPGRNVTLDVVFSPFTARASSALLLIRNNLTVLETIQLSGSAAYAQFKFGNRKPGSSTPLLFELTEKHLKDCERGGDKQQAPGPSLTVKRSFTARNTGPLPLAVTGFYISGLPCQGYGFRVINCHPFNLPPNATRKVEIAFTPDLSLSMVRRILSVGLGEVANYSLVATLPPFMLPRCAGALSRPAWEPVLYYAAVSFMLFLLACVLGAALLESDRAIRCALLTMARDTATVHPVLDLRMIGTGVASSAQLNNPTQQYNNPTHHNNPTQHNNSMQHNNPLSSAVRNSSQHSAKPPDHNTFRPSVGSWAGMLQPLLSEHEVPAKERLSSKASSESGGDSAASSLFSASKSSGGGCGQLYSPVSSGGGKRARAQPPMPIAPPTNTETVTQQPAKRNSDTSDAGLDTTTNRPPQMASVKAPAGSSKPISAGVSELPYTSPASHYQLVKHVRESAHMMLGGKCSNEVLARGSRRSKRSTPTPTPPGGCHKKTELFSGGRLNRGDSSTNLEELDTSSTTTESSSHDDGDKEVESAMSGISSSSWSIDRESCSGTNTSGRSHPAKTKQSEAAASAGKKAELLFAATMEKVVRSGSGSSGDADCEEEPSVVVGCGIGGGGSVTGGGKNGGRSGAEQRPSAPALHKGVAKELGQPSKVTQSRPAKTVSSAGSQKTLLVKRNSADKALPKRKGSLFSSELSTPSTPTTCAPIMVWGESRASFSDVVARSDLQPAPSYSSALAAIPKQAPPSSPPPAATTATLDQVYAPMVPAAATSATNLRKITPPLGPIGPKRPTTSLWGGWSDEAEAAPVTSSSSSLFTQAYEELATSTPKVAYDSAWTEQRDSLMQKMMHAEQQRRFEAEDYHRQNAFKETWAGVNSLWGDPIMYTPPLGGGDTVESRTQPLPLAPVGAPPVWGSDVWAPPAPPGLPPISRRQATEQAAGNTELEHDLGYDPFRSLSTIWLPNSPNIWKPPTTNNN